MIQNIIAPQDGSEQLTNVEATPPRSVCQCSWCVCRWLLPSSVFFIQLAPLITSVFPGSPALYDSPVICKDYSRLWWCFQKTSRSQPYLTFRTLFSWKIPEKLLPRLDLLYVAAASLLPSSAHQLLLRLSQGAVFAAEDDDDVALADTASLKKWIFSLNEYLGF